MEHIEITTTKEPRKTSAKLEALDFTTKGKYWIGVCGIIPEALRLLPHELYLGHKVIDWYDKVALNYENKINQLKNFSWQKK